MEIDGRRRVWARPLTLVLAGVVGALLLAYVGSYAYVSRRGMREFDKYDMEGFLYVPLEEVNATHDLSQHELRASFYAPLNWLDRQCFGGEPPTLCILFDEGE
jgi:hypothetical protein